MGEIGVDDTIIERFAGRQDGAGVVDFTRAEVEACREQLERIVQGDAGEEPGTRTSLTWGSGSRRYLTRSTHLKEYFGDSAVRLQTVSKQSVPTLYELLGRFSEKSGVPALLNTSLNYFDEPIACTPRDALKTYYASGLDLLVMENFVLSKS